MVFEAMPRSVLTGRLVGVASVQTQLTAWTMCTVSAPGPIWSYGVIQLRYTVTKYHLYIQSLSARKVLAAQVAEDASAEFRILWILIS